GESGVGKTRAGRTSAFQAGWLEPCRERLTRSIPFIIIKVEYGARKVIADSSGRNTIGGVPHTSRYQPVSLGEGNERSTPTNQRDRTRHARHHRGHGASTGPLFRDDGPILAKSP